MSRGPGKVEQVIEAAFRSQPDRTFSVEELAAFVYPGINRAEKKHRVAILRAADKVAERLGWTGNTAERPGGHIIYGNLLDVRSYALLRLRTDFVWAGKPIEVLEEVLTSGRYAGILTPGGAFHQHVAIHRAEIEGDMASGAELRQRLKGQVLREQAKR